MRALMIGAAMIALMGCQTPEQRAAALYSDFSMECQSQKQQALNAAHDAGVNTFTAEVAAASEQYYQWCMQQMYAGYEMQEANRIATASALLGYGASMSALSQPQSYQGAGGGAQSCMVTPLGRGGTQTVTCY